MSEKSALYKEVFKSLFLAFKRLSLYSTQHPLSREILTNLFSIFDTILREKPEIVFVSSPKEGHLILNDEVMDADVIGTAEIFERFKNFKLEGVIFTQGLTFKELADFVKALASAPAGEGGKALKIPAVLLAGSEHIQIRRIRYEKVEEGGAVVSEAEVGRGGGGAPVAAGIRDFLTDKTASLDHDAEGVFTQLDDSPNDVAEAIITAGKESGNFETVVKKFVAWISQHVVPIVLERKGDPSSFMEKVFDSFRKQNADMIFPTAEDTIRSCSDEIKLAMAFCAYSSNEGFFKKAVGLAAKVFTDERDQERLVPKLSEYLTGRGIEASKAREFVEKLKKDLAEDEDVSISRKKLHKLMKIAERYEEELQEGVRVATEDLTRLNKRLADEKERTDAIMRHVAEGVVVVDREGRILMMNPAAEKLLDSKAKESLGKYLVQSLKSEHLLAVAKDLDGNEANQLTKEIELDSKDETTKKVLRASTAVVENENGHTVGMVSVLSDITHEKQIEEIKSQFVSLVTHELRTPVVAIQKSLELIDSGVTGAVNDDQKRFLTISKLNLTRLNSLINDLLDMSKLEAGKFVLIPSSFDMRNIIQEVKQSLFSWIHDKEIDVKVHLPEEPVVINADKDRLVQVLVNLFGNALKFTPKKGEVNIALEVLERKGKICEEPCIEVMVHDSGIGIDPKDFKRIFNKFEQVSLVSPVGTGGTGLGLSIAREIVYLHGGDIWVESRKGEGSTFRFVLPRAFRGGKKSG